MAYHARKNIVTDGLIFSVDANNKLGGNVSNTRNLTNPSEVGTFTNGASVVNGAFDFDGVDDHLNFGDILDNYIDLDKTFTMSVWVNPNALNTNNSIIAKREGTPGYQFNIFQSNILVLFQNAIGQQIEIQGSTTINTNEWSLLSITYDASETAAGTLMYVNGSLDSVGNVFNDDITGGSMVNNDNLVIGVKLPLLIPFNGKVSNVKIYNKELTPDEIKQNYEAQKHRFE